MRSILYKVCLFSSECLCSHADLTFFKEHNLTFYVMRSTQRACVRACVQVVCSPRYVAQSEGDPRRSWKIATTPHGVSSAFGRRAARGSARSSTASSFAGGAAAAAGVHHGAEPPTPERLREAHHQRGAGRPRDSSNDAHSHRERCFKHCFL